MLEVSIKNVVWTITGNNEKACASDIKLNNRVQLSDYLETMFRQRYGCKVKVSNRQSDLK